MKKAARRGELEAGMIASYAKTAGVKLAKRKIVGDTRDGGA